MHALSNQRQRNSESKISKIKHKYVNTIIFHSWKKKRQLNTKNKKNLDAYLTFNKL